MNIRKYDLAPSSGFVDRIYERAGTANDSAFITECIDAHVRMHNAIRYMEQSVADHGYFEQEVITYILTGMDQDSFENAAKAEALI